MMYKEEIQENIERCRKNINHAQRMHESSGKEYWDEYARHEKRLLAVFEKLLKKAKPTIYADEISAALSALGKRGYRVNW